MSDWQGRMLSGYSAADVELCLKQRHKTLQFPPALEAAFQEVRRQHRITGGRMHTTLAVVVYNLFLFDDYLLLPHTLLISVFIHAFVCTSAILYAGKATFHTSLAWRELPIIFSAFLIVLQILFIALLNGNAAASLYMYFAVSVTAHVNLTFRMDYRYARFSSALLSTAIVAALVFGNWSLGAKIAESSVLGGLVYASLFGNYQLERADRYQFLRHRLGLVEIHRELITAAAR